MHFVPFEGRTQCLLRQVIQIYGTITPLHIKYQTTNQHRVHTSKNTLRNTEGWSYIHIQSDGIEYRNRFRKGWGYNCQCSL